MTHAEWCNAQHDAGVTPCRRRVPAEPEQETAVGHVDGMVFFQVAGLPGALMFHPDAATEVAVAMLRHAAHARGEEAPQLVMLPSN